MVKLLIENGARINVKNELGATPLDEARMMRKKEVAEFLKEHGAKSGRDLK
jgi:ankyrin repeat protein